MEFLSLSVEEHDSDADTVLYFHLRLKVTLGDPSVHSLLPLPTFGKTLHGSGAGGKKQIQLAKAALALSETPALSLLCLVTGMRILLIFKSSEAH